MMNIEPKMIEREKALEDVQNMNWNVTEDILGEWFEVWWSSRGLPDFEAFLKERGINVV